MRTSADITIHRIDGTTLTVPITPEARRTWRLMREDSIRLRWDSADEYRAKVGDWVNDELFGPFYVTEEQEPTFDTATGAYRHDIRFDRDYIGWRNVLHMLAYSSGWNLYRRETDWSLTDTPGHHLDEIVKGLSVLGYNVSAVVEPSVESPNSAVTLSFSGTSVYDALNALSGACSCEWWVTYNGDYTASVIHLGKYELSNEPHVITLGDNAEDITPNKTSADRANRIYAFGSTRNIPDTYRKTLMFQVTDSGIRTSGDSSASVFRDSTRVVRRDMLKGGEAADLSVRLATPVYDGDGDNEARKEAVFSQSVTVPAMTRFSIKGRLEYVADFRYHEGEVDIRTLSWSLKVGSTVIASGSMPFSPQEEPAGRASKTITADVDSSITLTPGDHTIAFSVKSDTDVFDLVTATANAGALDLKDTGHAVDCPLIYEGNTYIVTFNPLAEEQAQSVFNWFAFKTTAPSGFGNGSMFTLGISDDGSDGLLPLKIPMSFYTDNFGELSSVKMVGERRLMLPESTPGYVQDGSPETRSLIERVVVFDEIYPKLYLEITEITEGSYADNIEWSDGSRSYGSLPKFTIKAKRITSRGLQDFTFRRDYLTSSPLQAVFATSAESGSSHDSSLSGMTFGLNFNEADQTYTIAFNEDYGVKLPNGTLKPVVGDGFILTGWNVEAITSLGIVDDAENDLLAAARAYLQAVSTPAFSWRCRMMSDSIMEGGLLEPGQRVTVVRGSLSDTTRIIGFEYKLDIPEDTPQYDCGETETYSHFRDLEKKLNAQTKSATASSGTVSSSYSASNESSGATLNGALSWKSGSMDDFAGDTFNGEEDKTITIPTEIGHLQGNESLPRIGKAEESTPEGTVVSLIDKDGNVILPKSSLDWFIAESYEEDGETKYRLKLNPKYQGMYAEGWVSAGGLSDQGGGGGGSSYLKDLLDVSLPAVSQIGLWQGLLWDGEQWVNGDVERPSNRVTSVSSASTNTQYPTAKAVYDIVNTMLSSVLRSQGITTTPITNGSTTNPIVIEGKGSYTASEGDVVIRDDLGLEFMWTGGKWRQFGDESSYALKTVTITGSGYLTGGGNLEAARTIDIATEIKTKIDNGATAYANLGNYLPLTGGTMTGDILQKMATDSSNYRPSFQWVNTSGVKIAEIGYMNTSQAVIINPQGSSEAWDDRAGKYSLKIFPNDNGLTFNANKVWHAGNDGSGSGLDADLLDGMDSAAYLPAMAYHYDKGIFVQTDIGYGIMLFIRITGNSYGNRPRPIHSEFQAYRYIESEGYISASGINYGEGLGPLTLFDYNGHVCFWFSQLSNFETFFIEVFTNTTQQGNHITSVTNAAMPDDSLISYKTTITPTVTFSATKLETARTIWGQNFDGTGNVTGSLTLAVGANAAIGSAYTVANQNKYNFIIFGNASEGLTYTAGTWTSEADAEAHRFYVCSPTVLAMTIKNSGNVGIGTPSPAYKLDVAGDLRASGKVYIGSTGAYFEVDSNGYLHTNFPLYSDSWVSAGGVSDTGGGGAASYLHELLDVDDDLNPSTGQALVWDGTEWAAGGDISGYEKTDNKVTSISSLSTDTQYPSAKAVYTALADYLPLAGGVMTGVEKMVAGATPRTSGSYLSFVHYSDSSEVRDADVSAKNDGFLGLYARNGIALRPGTGSAFDTAKGLSVTASDITFNDTSLINTYAKKSVTVKGSGYLSGGGNLEANRTIDIAESIKEKIDNGATAYANLGNYLPLTGGTVSGWINHVNEVGDTYRIERKASGGGGWSYAPIAFTGGNDMRFFSIGAYGASENVGYAYLGMNAYDGNNLRIDGSGLRWGENEVWHAGNDGSGSGLDADLLDGIDSNGFMRSFGISSTASSPIDLNDIPSPTLNQVRTDYRWSNVPQGSIGAVIHLPYSPDWIAQIFAPINSDSKLYVRNRYNGTTWSDWHEVAYTDSNVASATKLQTARTIWGQNFDGTGNVSGLLTSVTGIHMTGNLMVGVGEVGPYLNKNGISIHNASNAWTADALKFDASGNASFYHNVGIGTTSPAYKLDVSGGVRATSGMRMPQIELAGMGASAGHGGYIDFHYNDSTADYTSRVIESASGTLGINSVLYAVSGGNVGIGTASPSYKLDVNGHARVTNRLYLSASVYIYADSNGCLHTNAPIISDSYISAGGVSTT